MELKQIDRILLKILYFAAAGIIVTRVLGYEDITSMLFYLTFPTTALIWLETSRYKITKTNAITVLACSLAVISVLLNAAITNTMLSIDYLRKLIMFITTLLFLQSAYRIKIDRKMSDFILHLADFLTLFFIASYFIFGVKMYYINGILSRYLTFMFDNPNLTGLFLVCLYTLEIYRIFAAKKRSYKFIRILMSGILAFFIILTQSRNSILVLFMVTASCLWVIFRSRRKLRVKKIWAIIVSVFPAIFIGGYMILVYVPWVQKVFEFFTGEGKSLSSRVRIWSSALETLWESPIIGAYSQISNGTGMSQMHNSHLDIVCSYGIPVLMLVCYLIYKYLYQNGKVYEDKESFIYVLGFACAIMLGIGEAALFSGGLGIYIFIGTFLLMAEKSSGKS